MKLEQHTEILRIGDEGGRNPSNAKHRSRNPPKKSVSLLFSWLPSTVHGALCHCVRDFSGWVGRFLVSNLVSMHHKALAPCWRGNSRSSSEASRHLPGRILWWSQPGRFPASCWHSQATKNNLRAAPESLSLQEVPLQKPLWNLLVCF